MNKLIITAGKRYADIDAFACAVAYKELAMLQGKDAEIVFPGPLNHSVTPTVRNWNISFLTSWNEEADFVVVDVSEPDHIAEFVDQDNIVAIYDHHFGFDDYWHAKLGKHAVIEVLGACATLIWEEFKKQRFSEKISATAANALAVAIISNTLNFNASVTHDRDRQAFNELQPYITLPEKWIEDYFVETEQEIFKDPLHAIRNDTKVQEVRELSKTFVIGQIELWDSRKFIAEHQNDIQSVLESYGNEYWFMTSPSISEGINYIYTKNEYIKNLFTAHFATSFSGDIGTTQRLWMRKELLKVLYDLK